MSRPGLSCILVLAMAACGSEDNTDPNTLVVLTSWVEVADVFESRPLNVSCFNTASTDMVRTGPIVLDTTVTDFQTDALLPMATVTAFAGVDETAALGTAMSDATGALSITIAPHATQARIGFKMVEEDSFPTFLLQQYLNPTGSPQTSPSSISAVSFATGAALPALVGVTRTIGTGVLAGAIRDCDGNELAGFTATVSSVRDEKMPLEGSRTFYFGDNGLPARNTVKPIGNKNGLFVVLELQPTLPGETAFVQMWGYPTQADLDDRTERLLSVLEVPVIADNIVTGSYELNRL